jgi:anti-sigma factor RsiW
MKSPCRESELDALLARELSQEEARRVSAHAAACETCRERLAWLRLEREWMARRARQQPARRALDYGALEARLRPAPPRRDSWQWRGVGMAAVAAGLAAMMLSGTPPGHVPSRAEEPWSEGLVSRARVEACMDPSLEEAARMEARVGACLVATPSRPAW